MSKNREQKHAKHLAEKHSLEKQQAKETEQHPTEAHLVEVPKGTSRLRFILSFVLVVFLLLVFSITGPMMSALSGGSEGGDAVFMSWTLPDGQKRTLNTAEFFQEKRAFATLEIMYPILGMAGIDPGDNDATARFLITEDMAHFSGVSAATDDLEELILTAFGDAETYKGYIASRRDLTPLAFEALLRRGRTAQRYTQLLASGVSALAPTEIADAWSKNNQEYNFQYVELTNEDFSEAARASLPGDEALEDWFDGLSPFEKAGYNTSPSWSADLAWLDTSSSAPMQALMEAYPRPEDEDAEEMALNYYNSFSYVRFLRPTPEDGGAEEEQDAERFLAYEDVTSLAQREAPIYNSLVDWLSDMQTRLDEGEVVDLQTEAIALGLTFAAVDPRTSADWAEGEEPWSGNFLAQSTGGLPEGRLATRVTVEEGAFVIAQVVEKFAASLPPFSEVRDRVADSWAEERRAELAVESLVSLRAEFEVAPEDGDVKDAPRAASTDLEAFKSAVTAAGYTLVERGFKTRYSRPGDDPSKNSEADNFLQNSTQFYTLEEGTLPVPSGTRDGKLSFLVRVGGKRDPELSMMDPGELAMMKMQLGRTAEMAFFQNTYENPKWIKAEFSLYLKSWESDNDEPAN
jgi:hypothetical protein